MFPLDYALAVALIACPSERDFYTWELWHLETLRPTLQNIAEHWEILDKRERRYMFCRSEDFATDLKSARRRYRDLNLRNAPVVNDSMRFPDVKTIDEMLKGNREHYMYLQARREFESWRWWEYREAMQETDCLYRFWDTARDARRDCYYVTVRRQALVKLYEMLGDENFNKGIYPPHFPIWRFGKID